MRLFALAIALLATSPAFAKDVTLTLNDQEQKVFLALLDSALKNGGLANLQSVSQFIVKFQEATKGQAPSPTPPPPSPKADPEKPPEPLAPTKP